MHALFFDTETTGFPLKGLPIEHSDQPHIAQLAAALVNIETRQIESSVNLLVFPDGWVIPEAAAKVHGISNERAATFGVSEESAILSFLALALPQNLSIERNIVAHNIEFDFQIISIALHRRKYDPELISQFFGCNSFCTMKEASKIMQLPPTEKMVRAGFTKNKPPNLGEAYKFFTGKTLEGAHDAMIDVHACIDVYFGLMDRDAINDSLERTA